MSVTEHIICDASLSPFQNDMTPSTFRIEPVFTGFNYYLLSFLLTYLLILFFVYLPTYFLNYLPNYLLTYLPSFFPS
jgi:hypothetical protein